MSEEREWILTNVKEICADTKNIDDVCMGLEQLSIFATEMIQDMVKQLFNRKELIDKIKEQISLYLDIAYSSEETFVRIEDLEYILMLIKEYEDENNNI